MFYRAASLGEISSFLQISSNLKKTLIALFYSCGALCQTQCTEKVERICSKCDEPKEVLCSTDMSSFQCNTKCTETLPCGHKCADNGGTCFQW